MLQDLDGKLPAALVRADLLQETGVEDVEPIAASRVLRSRHANIGRRDYDGIGNDRGRAHQDDPCRQKWADGRTLHVSPRFRKYEIDKFS